MELWITATIAAAFFQTLRFMLQKVLATGTLSATGSTLARFAYAQPFAWVVLAGYLALRGGGFPAIDPVFWLWGLAGGVGQILATVMVVMMFRTRNFAVGITLKKTEVIQTALLGLVLLGEVISVGGWLAIGIGLAGVLLLSKTPGDARASWRDLGSRVILLGLASGFFFAVSGVGYRAATLAVDSADPFLRALVALSFVNLMQCTVLLPWLRWREPGQIAAVWGARKVAVWMGLASMAGSLGWFTAFTQQTAAYVFALGQVELIFSLAASVLFFRERVTVRELGGIALLTASILVLVLVV
ncbi:DMT family transporter [Thalassococcus sp. CAU 1522]|uniref:DMT family transporter n=1 Tax=Thalassococcus arenae TaxID=2851652 RepID=A0ABS6N3Y3_9RHOB|nr:DMT family transporter [Thalassococcus arenae]MBV2358728.1 DMT family transporter [Thalassococcus arenae]